MTNTKTCPVSGDEMPYYDQRFPETVCDSCAAKAVDDQGNKVEFFNEDMSGGMIARHYQPDGQYADDHNAVCFIDGKKCIGVEFHMGGIGIELAH